MRDRHSILEALEEEINSWDEGTPAQVAVPGQFLVDVYKLLTESKGTEVEADE